MEAITNFFSSLFGDNAVLATILIAVVPMIELKGAIPFGMSKNFWTKPLTSIEAFGYGFIGSILVVPILAIIFKPIYNYLKDKKFFNKIISFFTGSLQNKSAEMNLKTNNKTPIKSIILKMLSVFLFVAFPVPLTGVWTGTCLAVLLGLNFWQIMVSVITGNFVCGIIVTFVCNIFPNATNIILYVFIVIIILAFAIKLIFHFIKKKKDKPQSV